jgi:hypothetical protein
MGLLNKDLNTITEEIKSFKYFCARNSLGCGKLDVDSLQCKVNELQRDLRNYNSEKINKIKEVLSRFTLKEIEDVASEIYESLDANSVLSKINLLLNK